MPTQYLAAMTAGLPLTSGCTAVFEARDATTGNAVSGVKVIDPTLYGVDLTGDQPATGTDTGDVPLFIPLPAESL